MDGRLEPKLPLIVSCTGTDLRELQSQWIAINSARVAFCCIGGLICAAGLYGFERYAVLASRSSAGFPGTARMVRWLLSASVFLTAAHFAIAVAESVLVGAGTAKCHLACLRDCNSLTNDAELVSCRLAYCDSCLSVRGLENLG